MIIIITIIIKKKKSDAPFGAVTPCCGAAPDAQFK
jgi:hypothetical protein